MPITRTTAERTLRARLALQRIGLAADDPPPPADTPAGGAPTTEAEFLTTMIAHCQEAITTANAYLALPEDQRTGPVTDYANAVVSTETSNVAQMQGWLDAAPDPGAAPNPDSPPLSGVPAQ